MSEAMINKELPSAKVVHQARMRLHRAAQEAMEALITIGNDQTSADEKFVLALLVWHRETRIALRDEVAKLRAEQGTAEGVMSHIDNHKGEVLYYCVTCNQQVPAAEVQTHGHGLGLEPPPTPSVISKSIPGQNSADALGDWSLDMDYWPAREMLEVVTRLENRVHAGTRVQTGPVIILRGDTLKEFVEWVKALPV